jgi:cell shape-determining protein MreD
VLQLIFSSDIIIAWLKKRIYTYFYEKQTMSFLQKQTIEQLKKWNRLCLVFAVLAVLVMCGILVTSLFQISEGTENAWLLALGPSILLPFVFVPLLFSALISSELKKRKR